MSLLFDENLSERLIKLLHDSYRGSKHVDTVGLGGHPDQAIWEYASREGLAIVSKDNDFRQLSFLFGPPPKVIWLSVGNAGTEIIAAELEARRQAVDAFLNTPEEGLLVIEIRRVRSNR